MGKKDDKDKRDKKPPAPQPKTGGGGMELPDDQPPRPPKEPD